MKSAFVVTLLSIWTLPLPSASAQELPRLNGYVTDPGSPERFAVDGTLVFCNAQTQTGIATGDRIVSQSGCSQRILGEKVKVFGTKDRRAQGVTATRIESAALLETRVEGFAIIDGMVGMREAGSLTVRADGYQIQVTPATHSLYNPPLTGIADIGTNRWLRYTGRLQQDGAIVAQTAEFSENRVPRSEDKLRARSEFDPSAVGEKDRQGRLSKGFVGLRTKHIPAYVDPAMQARVTAIGNRVVPAYQKALPDTDPTKLRFRFQLVDQPGLRDALNLPNGIILVPKQVVERLRNDSQLAAVLADNVAGAMEKQTFREIPAAQEVSAAEIAGAAGELFIPGLSIATDIGGAAARAKMLRRGEEQSGRVSLGLLSDAGFDITQAPVTWWLLSSPKPKSLEQIAMPYRAAYLYGFLGSTKERSVNASRPAAIAPALSSR